ncbi:MAG: DUF305 domain-containing protein [Longimicrobiales bacterium]
MTLAVRGRAGLAVVVTSLTTACAGASVAEPRAPAPDRPPATELEALYFARLDSARARYIEADVRFVTGMISHHAQAIEMADLVPSRSANASIRTLAARIINAQRDEIAWMELWLRDRDQPIPMGGPGVEAHVHEHLAGMITPEQLAELARSTGSAFDRLFLTLMIQHHRGAVAMVNELLATDGAVQAPATFKLASDIHVDQTTEIARMEQMLAALPPGDLR